MKVAPVQMGDMVELAADVLVAGGDALCRAEGYPIFVPGLFPGDVAEVRIVEVRKGFARGEVSALRTPSPSRRTSPCPVANECGGCDWAELRLDAQLDAKRRILSDSLRRTGRLSSEQVPPIRVHASPLNYRLRSRLHRNEESGEIGFFARRSHQVVPLSDRCEVVSPSVIADVPGLQASIRGGDTVDLFDEDAGLRVVARHESEPSGEEVVLPVGRWRYRLSTASFFQVNRHLLPRLIELVKAAAAGAGRGLALDLYGGVGFFALPLSEDFDEVVSVESGSESAAWATANVEDRKSIMVVRQNVEEFLSATRRKPDFVLVDPPRAGLSPRVRGGLAKLSPKRIAYLSCDPVTFSRDVAELVGHGWKLHTLDLVDLFPNTHHVETLASLVIAD